MQEQDILSTQTFDLKDLLDAIKNKDNEKLNKIIAQNPELVDAILTESQVNDYVFGTVKPLQDCTPLFSAICFGNVQAVEILLAHGANPEQKTNNHPYSPLTRAIYMGGICDSDSPLYSDYIEIIKKLAEKVSSKEKAIAYKYADQNFFDDGKSILKESNHKETENSKPESEKKIQEPDNTVYSELGNNTIQGFIIEYREKLKLIERTCDIFDVVSKDKRISELKISTKDPTFLKYYKENQQLLSVIENQRGILTVPQEKIKDFINDVDVRSEERKQQYQQTLDKDRIGQERTVTKIRQKNISVSKKSLVIKSQVNVLDAKLTRFESELKSALGDLSTYYAEDKNTLLKKINTISLKQGIDDKEKFFLLVCTVFETYNSCNVSSTFSGFVAAIENCLEIHAPQVFDQKCLCNPYQEHAVNRMARLLQILEGVTNSPKWMDHGNPKGVGRINAYIKNNKKTDFYNWSILKADIKNQSNNSDRTKSTIELYESIVKDNILDVNFKLTFQDDFWFDPLSTKSARVNTPLKYILKPILRLEKIEDFVVIPIELQKSICDQMGVVKWREENFTIQIIANDEQYFGHYCDRIDAIDAGVKLFLKTLPENNPYKLQVGKLEIYLSDIALECRSKIKKLARYDVQDISDYQDCLANYNLFVIKTLASATGLSESETESYLSRAEDFALLQKPRPTLCTVIKLFESKDTDLEYIVMVDKPINPFSQKIIHDFAVIKSGDEKNYPAWFKLGLNSHEKALLIDTLNLIDLKDTTKVYALSSKMRIIPAPSNFGQYTLTICSHSSTDHVSLIEFLPEFRSSHISSRDILELKIPESVDLRFTHAQMNFAHEIDFLINYKMNELRNSYQKRKIDVNINTTIDIYILFQTLVSPSVSPDKELHADKIGVLKAYDFTLIPLCGDGVSDYLTPENLKKDYSYDPLLIQVIAGKESNPVFYIAGLSENGKYKVTKLNSNSALESLDFNHISKTLHVSAAENSEIHKQIILNNVPVKANENFIITYELFDTITVNFKIIPANHPLNLGKHVDYTSSSSKVNAPSIKLIVDNAKGIAIQQKNTFLCVPADELEKFIKPHDGFQENIGSFYETLSDERELYIAALEKFTNSSCGGTSIGSCLSGKDRKAIVIMYTHAMQIFFMKYRLLYKFEDSAENKEKFAKIFASIYCSKHFQTNAAQNTPGANGIKTPDGLTGYLPGYLITAIKDWYNLRSKMDQRYKHMNGDSAFRANNKMASNNTLKIKASKKNKSRKSDHSSEVWITPHPATINVFCPVSPDQWKALFYLLQLKIDDYHKTAVTTEYELFYIELLNTPFKTVSQKIIIVHALLNDPNKYLYNLKNYAFRAMGFISLSDAKAIIDQLGTSAIKADISKRIGMINTIQSCSKFAWIGYVEQCKVSLNQLSPQSEHEIESTIIPLTKKAYIGVLYYCSTKCETLSTMNRGINRGYACANLLQTLPNEGQKLIVLYALLQTNSKEPTALQKAVVTGMEYDDISKASAAVLKLIQNIPNLNKNFDLQEEAKKLIEFFNTFPTLKSLEAIKIQLNQLLPCQNLGSITENFKNRKVSRGLYSLPFEPGINSDANASIAIGASNTTSAINLKNLENTEVTLVKK